MKNPNLGRTLKSPFRREPKNIVPKNEWIRELSDRTGYPMNALSEVVSEMIEIWKEALLNKKGIRLYGLGKLFTYLKPGKDMVNMHAEELYYQDDFYSPKFVFGKTFRRNVRDMEVLPEEVEDMYDD